ncbi:MAG: hypothetical protein QX198_14705 [Methylococcaceae bacterium]
MDIDALINHVFKETKTRISADDPLFALVAINEAILTAFLARATEEIHVATNEIELQTGANIAAAKALDTRIDKIKNDSSAFLRNCRKTEVETATVEIRKVAALALTETLTLIANKANTHISNTLGEKLTANIKSLNEAEEKLSGAVSSFDWKWRVFAGSAAAGTIFAVLLVAWLSVWWQRSQIESLSEQRQALTTEIAEMQVTVAKLESRGGKIIMDTCGKRPCIKASTNQGEGSTKWIAPWNSSKGIPLVIPLGY